MHGKARLSEVIRRRARVTPPVAALLALLFALVVAPIALVDSWLFTPVVVAGEPAPVTIRVPAFEGWDDEHLAGRGGSVVVARGEIATPRQAAVAEAMRTQAPNTGARFAAYAAVLFLLTAGVTHQMRRSNRGRLLRVQACILGTVALGAAVTKGLLLLYPVSVLAVPVALGALVPTLVFDRTVGLAAGVLSAVTMSLLVPFDVGISTVLVVQAVAAAIVIPDRARARWRVALGAGLVAMAGAALTYLGFFYLSDGVVPVHELSEPGRSAWLAAAFGGAVAGLLAMPLLPVFETACGEITHGRLVALEDLSHPVLKQIADKAPGTWQHSLAMANLAEVAAQAIGGNGRLVRVGAYFHDLGKSLQPSYFIENLRPGEVSPHDQLAPEVSCDAIFAHVTEGIALARRQRVPERIIDFMHMHHGDGVLEYFWAKCQEQGNPRRLTVDDFRYPGVRPQSRETAILAICDAVEAASRTLKRPDDRAVETLVQRIVYGKLHLGQLDESGLSMADLRQISDSLREAIRAAHHGRIEYPWQREAAAASAETPPTMVARAATATQQIMHQPRLDSLDVPRPIQWEDTSGRPRTAAEQGIAATVPMVSPVPIAETTPLPLAPVETVSMKAPAPAPLPWELPPEPPVAKKAPALVIEAAQVVPEPTATGKPPPPPPPLVPSSLVEVTEPNARPITERITERVPVTLAVTEPVAEAVAVAEPVSVSEPDSVSESVSESVSDSVSDSVSEPVSDSDSDSDPGSSASRSTAGRPAIGPIPGAVPPPRTNWANALANRLDAMLDSDDDERTSESAPFASTPTLRSPPPPPRRRVTHEVTLDDVEAMIEVAPPVRPDAPGAISGPPPATRPPGARIPLPPPPDAPPARDDGPTVLRPRPSGSMLPPRSRTKPPDS